MLCYSFLEKRGGYIKKYINWSLYNNNELIIKSENIECEIIDNVIKYQENDNFINTIDLNKDIYIREGNDFIFKIDFINKKFDFLLKEQDLNIKDAIIDAKILKNELITLIYKLDNDQKKIIIQIL